MLTPPASVQEQGPWQQPLVMLQLPSLSMLGQPTLAPLPREAPGTTPAATPRLGIPWAPRLSCPSNEPALQASTFPLEAAVAGSGPLAGRCLNPVALARQQRSLAVSVCSSVCVSVSECGLPVCCEAGSGPLTASLPGLPNGQVPNVRHCDDLLAADLPLDQVLHEGKFLPAWEKLLDLPPSHTAMSGAALRGLLEAQLAELCGVLEPSALQQPPHPAAPHVAPQPLDPDLAEPLLQPMVPAKTLLDQLFAAATTGGPTCRPGPRAWHATCMHVDKQMVSAALHHVLPSMAGSLAGSICERGGAATGCPLACRSLHAGTLGAGACPCTVAS